MNAWYYTLSTVAQTLASILGLGAVFIVLRLDSLTKSIGEYKERGLNILEIKKMGVPDYRVPKYEWSIIKDLEEFSENYVNTYRAIETIDRSIRSLMTQYGAVGITRGDLGLVKDTPKYLRFFVDQRNNMIDFIKEPALITAFTIGLSITLLSISNPFRQGSLLWLIVILALLSGFMVIRAAWQIIVAIKKHE